MSHAPRIEKGNRFFVNTAVVHANDLQSESFGVLPSLYLGGARGWVADDGGRAFSAGLQVPVYLLPFVFDAFDWEILLATSYLDLYAQPWRAAPGGLDYGIGTLLSSSLLMPYLQFGRAGDGGVYTTQAVAVTFRDLDYAGYWLPAVAYRFERPDGRRAVDIYLNGGFDFRNHVEEWYVGFGVNFEWRN